MPYNASDRKQIRAAEKAQQRADLSKIEFLKSMLSQPGGRQYFWDLLESCHLFSDPFTGNPYHEAFLKGERNIGLRIFADIAQYCPDQYITMMKESNVRHAELASTISPDYDNRTAAEYAYGSEPGSEHGGSEDARWNAQGPELLPTRGDP